MPADQRREALIDATMEALRTQRRPLSTREIAQAAGVAEGTIFRIFASKDELIDAVVAKAFRPNRTLRVESIPAGLPLRAWLIEFVTIIQDQLQNVFGLMEALGITSPPAAECDAEADADRADRLIAALDRAIAAGGAELRVGAPELFRYLRLLTFAGSHPGISDGEILTPAQIVDVVLTGVVCRSGAGDGGNCIAAGDADGISSAGPLSRTTQEPTC